MDFLLDNPFDERTKGADAETILFPEVHLKSPIVRNQLRLILHVEDIDPGFELRDTTILLNNDVSTVANNRRRRGPLYSSAKRAGECSHNFLRSSTVKNSYEVHRQLITAQDRLLAKEAHDQWIYSLTHLDLMHTKDQSYLNECLGRLNHPEEEERTTFWRKNKGKFKRSAYRKSVSFWYMIRYWCRSVAYERCGGRGGTGTLKRHIGSAWDVYANGLWCVLRNKEGNYHVWLTHNQVLMYCDLVEGRWLGLLGATLSRQHPDLAEKMTWLLNHFDSLFSQLNENSYEIVESIEALLVGAIQAHDSTLSLAGQFLADTLASVRASLARLGHPDFDEFTDVLREGLLTMTPEEAAELFCVFRLWGHPPVEAGPAADKMREFMNAEGFTTMESLVKNRRAFRVMLINGYVRKHGGSWPNCQLDPVHCKNLSVLRMTGKAIPLDKVDDLGFEIDSLVFDTTFDIDLENDFSIYFKDKAIAPTLDAWDSVYQWSGMQYQPPKYMGHRRLLSYFLDDKDFNPYDYLDYVESRAYLDDPDFNVSTSLKEREVKLDGRLFAKMTPRMRGGQVIAESLLSKEVMPLMAENGMVRTEREIAQSLVKMNTLATGESPNPEAYYTLAGFLNTDIKKYCQSQRFECNAAIAHDLNNLFGLKELFHWQHKILFEHHVYVADPFCPPANHEHISLRDLNDRIKVEYCSGGIEGLSQKLWSTISITIIRDVARELGLQIIALVCGDNQVIAVTKRYPPGMTLTDAREDIAKLTKRYHRELARRLFLHNQFLKDRETIVSSDLLIFGKRILRNGRYLPQSLKAITRASLWAETTVEETRSACSNLATMMMKYLAQGGSVSATYFVHLLRTVEQLRHGTYLTLNRGLSSLRNDGYFNNHEFMALISRLPSQLGGFGYLLRDRLIVRNIGDPLSVSMADLKGLFQCGFVPKVVFNRILNQRPGNGSWLQLGLDPYSGNIQSTQSMTTILERITSQAVLAASPNPLLKGLFHQRYREEDETTARQLLDTERPAPRWASAVLKLLPTGTRKKITGYVETMKTTIRQACDRGGLTYDLKEKLMYYDRDQFLLIIRIILDSRADDDRVIQCAVTMAKEFRKRCWRHLLGDREMEGLETAPVVESLAGILLADGGVCNMCMFGKDKFAWAQIREGSSLTNQDRPSRLSTIPYMGSETEERSRVALLRPWRPSSPVKDGIRIAMLVVWRFGESDESWELALSLANTRFPVELNVLKKIVPSPAAANMNHRINDGDTQMSHFVGRDPRFARHIRLSTDKLNELIEGVEDTNFVFQPALLTCIAVLEDWLVDTQRVDTTLTYHLHLDPTCCIREVANETLTEVATVTIPESIMQLRENPIVYDHRGVQFREDQRKYAEGPVTDSPAERAKKTSDRGLIVQLSKALGSYVGGGIVSQSKMRGAGEIDMEVEGALTVTGLISELSASDPRLFLAGLAAHLLLDSASDLYYGRVFGESSILAWWANRLYNSPTALWVPLKSVLNSRKVLGTWLAAGVFVPTGSPNYYNSVSIETIHQWVITAMRHLLRNPNDLAESIVVADSRPDVLEQKTEVALRNIWMLGSLMGSIQQVLKFSEMQDKDEELENQFNNQAPETWKDAFDEGQEDIHQLVGTLFYHTRVLLTEIRRRGVQQQPQDSVDGGCPDPVVIFGDTTQRWDVPPDVAVEMALFEVTSVDPSNQGCKDYRHYLLRTVGINTTAHLKVVSILNEWKGSIKVRKVLCTAEGSGGILSLIGLLWPKSELFFNSLKSGSENDQRTDEYFPSEVMALHHGARDSVKQRVIMLDGGTPGTTDLSRAECVELILKKTKDLDMVTCDIENHDQHLLFRVWRNLLVIIVSSLRPGGRVLLKISTKYGNSWIYLLSWLRAVCTQVQVHSSPMSGADNGELYITGRRNNIMTIDDVLVTDWINSGHYPRNSDSPHEGFLREQVGIVVAVSGKKREQMVRMLKQEPTVTSGGRLCMDLGFMFNTGHLKQQYLGWVDYTDNYRNWKHIIAESRNDPKGSRLKSYGKDHAARMRAEIKTEITHQQQLVLLRSDITKRAITADELLAAAISGLDTKKRELVMKFTKRLEALDNLTMKQTYKVWTGAKLLDEVDEDN